MRFDHLSIPAFGPFTGFDYDFGKPGNADLHVFLGNNEAGKSSLLRAINNLLYGIALQSSENFRHNYSDLVIAATMSQSNGRSLSVQRRKNPAAKRLTDFNGGKLTQEQLLAFIGNVSQAQFQSMYGLGASELQQGNEVLLQSGGALDAVLAVASSGSAALANNITRLEHRAQQLYRPRSKTTQVIALTKNIKNLNSQLRQATTRPAVWEELENGLSQCRQWLAESVTNLQAIEEKRGRIQRYLQGIELSYKIRKREEALVNLSFSAAVPVGTTLTINRLSETARQGRLELTRLEASRESAQTKILAMLVNDRVLAAQADIESLAAQQQGFARDRQKLQELKLSQSGEKQRLLGGARRLGLSMAAVQDLEQSRISDQLAERCVSSHERLQRKRQVFRTVNASVKELRNRIGSIDSKDSQLNASIEDGRDSGTEAQANDNKPTEDRDISQPKVDSVSYHRELVLGQQTALAEAASRREAIDTLAQQLKTSMQLLSLSCEAELLADAKVPERQTIVEFQDKFSALTRKNEACLQVIASREEEQRQTEFEIQQLQAERNLPSAQQLSSARELRDELWHEHARLSDKGRSSDKQSQYLAALKDADAIADRLIADADAVAVMEARKLKLNANKRALIADKEVLVTLQLDQQALDLAWNNCWVPDEPKVQSPSAMLEWRERWLEAIKIQQRKSQLEAEYEQQLCSVEQILDDLQHLLPGIKAVVDGIDSRSHAPQLSMLREKLQLAGDYASRWIRHYDEGKGASSQTDSMRLRLTQELTQKQSELEESRRALEKAMSQMVQAFDLAAIAIDPDLDEIYDESQRESERVNPAGEAVDRDEQRGKQKRASGGEQPTELSAVNADGSLPDDADAKDSGISPDKALDMLAKRQRLMQQFDEFIQHQNSMEALQASIESFSDQAAQLAGTIHLNAKGDSASVDIVATNDLPAAPTENIDTRVNGLVSLLRDNESKRTRQSELKTQLENTADAIHDVSLRIDAADSEIAEVRDSLGVASDVAVNELLVSLERAESLNAELQIAKDTLAELGGAEPYKEFFENLLQHDPHQLKADLDALNAEKAELDESREKWISQRTSLENELAELARDSGEAADLQQQLVQAETEQARLAAEYISLRLSSNLLKHSIEEFREQNRGPLLEDASDLFARLTTGSFSGIALEYELDDSILIKGQRADGTRLSVPQMSDGSRDQLYLAMRLAALRLHLKDNEGMPLIIDDLLITFDDERSIAAMQVLGEIAAEMQVLVFTHHSRILDFAESSMGSKTVRFDEVHGSSNNSEGIDSSGKMATQS